MDDRSQHALTAALAETVRARCDDMAELVSGLPEGALDWRFAPEATPLAGLCLHIVHLDRHVAGLLSGSAGDFDATNGARTSDSATESDLREALDRVSRALADALERADLAQLPASVIEELDHASMHWGQMQLTRHAWEAAHPGVASAYVHWR